MIVSRNGFANIEGSLGIKSDDMCSTCVYPTSAVIEQVWGCTLDSKKGGLLGINQVMPVIAHTGDEYRLDKTTIPGGRLTPAIGRGKPLANNQESILRASSQTIRPTPIGMRTPIDPSLMVPPSGCPSIDVSNSMMAIIANAGDSLVTTMEYATWQVLANGVYSPLNSDNVPMAHYPYNTQQVLMSDIWDDLELNTPINDLMCVQARLGGCCNWEGNFDDEGRPTGARMYANSHTWRFIMMNSNSSDGANGPCCNRGWAELRSLLAGYSLPHMTKYDGQYYDSITSSNQYHIPTGTIVFVGEPAGGGNVGFNGIFRSQGSCSIESKAHIWIEDSCNSGVLPREIAVSTFVSHAPIVQHPECIAAIKTGLVDSTCGVNVM